MKIKRHECCCTEVSAFVSCLFLTSGEISKHLESAVELSAQRKEIQSGRFCESGKRGPQGFSLVLDSLWEKHRVPCSSRYQQGLAREQALRGAAFDGS